MVIKSKKLSDEQQLFSELIRKTQVSAKISRLVAQENITVQYSNDAETASFDIVRRVLTYPYSMVIEDEYVHDVLMFHEIGHALDTKSADQMRERSSEQIFDMWNIVEDIRIEKLMKRRYPGSRGAFQIGYERLYQKGFFGKKETLKIGAFATRLNFFCKAGPITAWFIKFDEKEKDFLRRCEAMETEDEAHALAIELAAMAGIDRERSKQLLLEERRMLAIEQAKWSAWASMNQDRLPKEDPAAEEDFSDEVDADADEDEEEVVVKAPATRPAVAGEETPAGDEEEQEYGHGGSITKDQQIVQRESLELTEEETAVTEKDEKRFEEILSEAEEHLLNEAIYFDPLTHFQKTYSETKISDARLFVFESIKKSEINFPDARTMYRAVMSSLDASASRHYFFGEHRTLDEINSNSVESRKALKKAVDYLARQFDAKKAAIRAKHAIISTSGQLDINRAFAHKFSDDIFLKKTSIRDAKNHGVMLLLDASGSIDQYWVDMVKQVLLITEFCRKVQIPFKVYIFGADVHIKDFNLYRPHPIVVRGETDVSHPFLSYGRDGDTTVYEVLSSEMTAPEYRTMVGALLQRSFFSLGGTPTTNALLNIESDMIEFFHRHNVSIKKLFIITDGGAADTNEYLKSNYTRCFISDPKTRKNYYINHHTEHYDQTAVDMIAKIYKDRYGIDTVHIALGNEKDVWNVTRRHRGRRVSKRHGYTYVTDSGYTQVTKSGMACSFGFEETFDGRELYRAYKKQNFLLKTTPLGLSVFFVKPTEAETEIAFRGWGGSTMIWDEKTNTHRKMTVKEMAESFSNGLASMKTSQTFLTILMQHIAVEIEG